MSGAFETSGSKDRDVTHYESDVDITIAAGEHRYGQDILYREGVVSGSLIETFEADLRTTGLSPLQVAISNTAHGQCWKLVPQQAALVMTTTGLRIGADAYEAYNLLLKQGNVAEAETLFKRVLIPETMAEAAEVAVKAQFPDLNADEIGAVIEELPPKFFDTLVYQKRGCIILNKELQEYDEGPLEGVSDQTVDLLIWAFNAPEDSVEAQNVIEHARSAFGELGIEFVAGVRAQRDLRLKAGETVYNTVGAEEIPVALPNWGLPTEITDAYRMGKRKFNGFIAQVPYTRERVCQLAAGEWDAMTQFLPPDLKVVSYEDISNVILQEEAAHVMALEAYEQRNDASRVWMNLGENVRHLSPTLGTRDARPRPTISHDLPGEVDVQKDALERDLLREVTPKDRVVRLGDTEKWGDMLPYYRDHKSNRLVGHPLASVIDQMLNALATPHEPLLFKDEDGIPTIRNPSRIERILAHEALMVDDRYMDIGGELAEVIKVHTSPNMKPGFMEVTVQIMETRPDYGYVHIVSKKDFDILNNGVRVLGNGEAVPFKPGDVVGFSSQPAFVLWRASLRQVPTFVTPKNLGYMGGIQPMELKMVGEFPAIAYSYQPLDVVFPKVWDFLSWAKTEYENGAGFLHQGIDIAPIAPMKSKTPGTLEEWMRPTDLNSWLWELQSELTEYQRWAMNMVQSANMPLVEDWVQTLISAYDAVGMDKSVLQDRFEDSNGQRTSLFGLLSQNMWATVKGLNEETLFLPRPMRLAYSGKDANGEAVQVWKPNFRMMWSIMGYGLNTSRMAKTETHLAYMVKESFLRSHPQDLVARREWDETTRGKSKTVAKRLVDPSIIGNYSIGLLGDMLANWWAVNMGLKVPMFNGNLLELGLPALMKMFPASSWGVDTAKRVYLAGQQWSRMKASTDGAKEFAAWVFDGPTSAYQVMGLSQPEEGPVVLMTKPAVQVEDVLCRRLMMQSPSPETTGELIRMALEVASSGDDQKRQAYLAMARVNVDTLGKEAAQAITSLLA